MISEKQCFDKLKTLNESINKTDQTFFASVLFELLKELEHQKIVEVLDFHAIKEKNEDSTLFIQQEQKILEELRLHNKKIEHYYAEQSIDLVPGFMGKQDISEFNAYEQQKIVNSGGLIESLFQSISNALSLLMGVEVERLQPEILKLIKKHALINKDGQVVRLIDPSTNGLQQTYLEINNFVIKNKILHPHLIKHLEAFVNHDITTKKETNKMLHQYGELMAALTILIQGQLCSSYHYDFVQQFARVNNEGHITGLLLGPNIIHWRKEKQRLFRIKTSTFWHSWDQLKYFYTVYANFESMQRDALAQGDLFCEWQLCDDFKKIDEIASGKQPEYMSELKRYQEKVFCYVEQIILSSDEKQTLANLESPQSKKKKDFIHKIFVTKAPDSNKIELKTDDKKDISLSRIVKGKSNETIQFRFLHLLWITPDGIAQILLQKELGLTADQIERAYRSINEIFKNKWTIDEYIIRSNLGKFKINDKYPTEYKT